MFAFYRQLKEPITSRLKAQRAAEASAYVWGVNSILFGFALLANLGRGVPAWSPYLALALCVIAVGALVHRRKSVSLAIATLIWAGVISVFAVLALLGGKGNAITIPIFVLPLAIRGLQGARALRELAAAPAA